VIASRVPIVSPSRGATASRRPRNLFRGRRLAAVGLVLAGFSVSACGARTEPAVGAAPAPPDGAGAVAALVTPTPPQRESVKLTYPSEGLGSLQVLIARDRGFFAAQGFEPETLLMSSDRAMAAMASGELHYVGGVGTASIAAAARGLPVRAVWVSASSPAYTVFARPEITTPGQLRGKSLAVPGLGGSLAVAVGQALKHYDLDLARDLAVVQIAGSDTLRLEALRAGAVDATALSAPQSLTARQDGFPAVVNVAALVQMPVGGLTVSTAKLQNERDQVRRMVRALTESQQWLLQNPDDTVQMIMEMLQVDQATARGTYDEAVPTYQTKGLVSRDGIENILEIVREGERIGPEVRFEDVADGQLAEEVARELGLIS
jgi:ABC-type nitrate/sulfonate/bicarbonate transport system substrate-binding protein